MSDKELDILKAYIKNLQEESNSSIYTNKILNTSEFISHIENNREHFRNYCEFLIFPDDYCAGLTFATPSHTERLLKYVMDKENLSREEVVDSIPRECSPMYYLADKYGVALCWYDRVLLPSDAHLIIHSVLTILDKKGIIDIVTQSVNNEYKRYLYRESLKRK